MLQDFFDRTLELPASAGVFEAVNARIVRVAVRDALWIARGALVAYHGDLRFRLEHVAQAERPRPGSGPVRSALRREAVPIVRAEGCGQLYLSLDAKLNRVVALEHETIFVVSTALLAFEASLDHEVRMVGGVGLLAGGVFVVRLSGRGRVAMAASGDPMTLRVAPGDPICAEPAAVMAWTSGLWPHLKTDLSPGSIVAHGGGEPIQMRFDGDGHVVVSPRSRVRQPPAGAVRKVVGTVGALV